MHINTSGNAAEKNWMWQPVNHRRAMESSEVRASSVSLTVEQLGLKEIWEFACKSKAIAVRRQDLKTGLPKSTADCCSGNHACLLL